MQRMTATVEGRTITRAQVEYALVLLHEMVQPTAQEQVEALRNGDRLAITYGVVNPADTFNEAENSSIYLVARVKGERYYVNIRHGSTWNITPAALAEEVAKGTVVLKPSRPLGLQPRKFVVVAAGTWSRGQIEEAKRRLDDPVTGPEIVNSLKRGDVLVSTLTGAKFLVCEPCEGHYSYVSIKDGSCLGCTVEEMADVIARGNFTIVRRENRQS